MDSELSKAEQHQVSCHQLALAAEQGCAVSWEEASASWLEEHAAAWRQKRQSHMLDMQREEIARYRWIRSEEEHHDLGRQAAMEWVQKYAKQWRKWYEDHHERVS